MTDKPPTDEIVVEKLEETPTPDYGNMPFEELAMLELNSDKHIPALANAIDQRRDVLNLASKELLNQVDTYQDEMDERLKALEEKFDRLLKLIDRQPNAMKVGITVEEFVKGEIR